MKEQIAKEKLRIVDVIKENAAMVITIGGIIWGIYSMIILPIKKLEYDVNNILTNHLKTIQDEYIIAAEERREQGGKIELLTEQVIELKTLLKEHMGK